MNLRKRLRNILGISMVCCMLTDTVTTYADTNLSMTATPVENENYIHLEWTNLGQGYSYMVHAKGQDESIYQSIPTKKTVKTLNIYPDSGIPNTGLSSGQVDLDGKSVPDSGILKTWLLKENIDDVTIDSISLSSFNANPSKYLVKENGKWNYDSVFYGMWNLLPDNIYPNDNAIEYLRTFINDGGGFMTSHHTIGYRALDRGVNKLGKEMGVEIFSTQPNSVNSAYSGRDANGNMYDTVSFEKIENVRADLSPYWPSGRNVKIVKNGLLINYPFKVGEIGDVITIPYTHGLGLLGKGEVWMNVENPTGFGGMAFKEVTESPTTGEKGTNNFYVHTYNNTAIINSGHSFPSITTEETRIIANTLYYLSQVTEETECDDHKSQDFAAPDKVNITGVASDGNNLKVSYLESQDNGTEYEYYVVATDANGNETTSETISAVNKSGFAGYSYVIDNVKDTDPDNKIDTTDLTISKSLSELDFTKPIYVHIKAVDKVGNSSETTHYEYGCPLLTLTPSTTEKTNAAVTITAKATSETSKISYVQTPDGTWVEGDTAQYNARANGSYTFAAIDENGVIVTQSITISNIDDTKVILNIEPEKDNIYLEDEVEADLTIDNIQQIAAEDVRIKYDSSKLQFLGIDPMPGIKVVKDEINDGELRFILASQGIENVVFMKKSLLKLHFKGISEGAALVDVIKGRISDGMTMERDLFDNQCGQATITIENYKDVNKNGEFTLLDLAIDGRYYGGNPADYSPQYITDIAVNGAIDDDDLLAIGQYMLENPNYNF